MDIAVVDLSAASPEEIGRACEEIGFLTVVGHGVPDGLVERMAQVSRSFFEQPEAVKLGFADGGPAPGLPAYRPLRSESLAASLGTVTPGDLKESLDWGPAVPGFGWLSCELRAAWPDYFESPPGLG